MNARRFFVPIIALSLGITFIVDAGDAAEFMSLCRNNDPISTFKAQRMLNGNPELVFNSDAENNTPLHLALIYYAKTESKNDRKHLQDFIKIRIEKALKCKPAKCKHNYHPLHEKNKKGQSPSMLLSKLIHHRNEEIRTQIRTLLDTHFPDWQEKHPLLNVPESSSCIIN